jgi:signal transduction histidine kinase
MASGDLAARVEVSSKDEIGDVAHRFNEMAASLAERTEQLRSKTNDINVMLHTLPQGILTIVADGGIHPEYSSYLETILEKPGLAGLQATAVLFEGSDLCADARASMEAAIAAASGEEAMNFEFNSHLLPGEVKKTMPDGRVKLLELTWSPISDDADIVEKIMVSVRDVTEMRRIMAEADHRRQELEMIGQILRVPQEKFDEFISGARSFIAENIELIHSASGASPDLLARLFRNMHTIKGNARTFNLLHITSLVHDTEQVYQSMRDTGEPAFEPAALITQLEAVSVRLEDYAKLNTVTLGRTGSGRRGVVEEYVMVRRERVEAMLDWLRAYDLKQTQRETLAAVLQQVRCDLELLGTEPLADVLAPVTGSMPGLARELGKEPPAVRIVDNGLSVRNQAHELLRNIFTHLYRNAIDHGIETAAERIAVGKHPAGEVVLAAQMDGERVLLELFDDGRGLALVKVRAKAAERGLVGQGRGELPDREAANLIFASGFSTAAAVTEVSGRGVGMDAVREFLKAAGGDIEIRLTGGAEGDDFRAFRMVVSLPAELMAKASPESPTVSARAPKPVSTKPPLLGQVIDSLTGGEPKGAEA